MPGNHMVIASGPTGRKLHCWNFIAQSQDCIFLGFVVAKSQQEAESQAEFKAREQKGIVLKVSPFSDCEIETLEANGVWRRNARQWLTDEECKTVLQSNFLSFNARTSTKLIKAERYLACILKSISPQKEE